MKPLRTMIFLLGLASAQAEDGVAAAQAMLTKSYHADPLKLTGKAFKDYDAEIMKLWETAEQHPKAYVPALEKLLPTTEMEAYFYWDGAQLLLSLDNSAAHRQLAAKAMARANLSTVPGENVLRALMSLAHEDIDVTPVALRMLNDEKFSAFIPQHVLTLGLDYCFLYGVSQSDPKVVLAAIQKRLEQPMGPKALFAVANWAWQMATPETDAFMKLVLSKMPTGPEKERLTSMVKALGDKVLSKSEQAQLATLRKQWRKYMTALSDEALGEADATALKMRQLCGDKFESEPAKQSAKKTPK